MKKSDMVYIDNEGQAWITAEAVANLWNKRAQDEFHREGRYTRWAARNRVEGGKGDLPYRDDDEHGRLYSKSAAETVKLRPRSKPRPASTRSTNAFKRKAISEQS
jgi:hypothetical protein